MEDLPVEVAQDAHDNLPGTVTADSRMQPIRIVQVLKQPKISQSRNKHIAITIT